MPAKAKSNGNAQRIHSRPAATPPINGPKDLNRDGIQVPPERRCAFRTQKGSPCRAARRKDSSFCIFHDRDLQERRAQARVGDHFFQLRDTPDSAEGIHEILRRNIEAVASGKISPRVANSISYAAQLMIANLSGVEQARTAFNIQQDAGHQLARHVVSAELDRIETEIREAGEQAYPARVAEAYRQSRSPQGRHASPTEHTRIPPRDVAVAQPTEVPQVPSVDTGFRPPPPGPAEEEEMAAGRRAHDPGHSAGANSREKGG